LVSLLVGAMPSGGAKTSSAVAQVQTAPVAVAGHGWGHGRGLGQWGAYGYSLPPYNWSAGQILDHFYGDTSAANIGNPAVEVVMNAPNSTSNVGMAGPTIAFLQRGTPHLSADFGPLWPAPAPAVYVSRVGPGQFNVHYGSSCAGPWGAPQAVNASFVRIFPVPGSAGTLDDALQLCDGAMSGGNPDNRRWLRGEIWARATASRQYTTNRLTVEEYLPGVVPFEMPTSWTPAALQAQAVAARSYSLADAASRASTYGFPATCDTISCQVYGGRQRFWSGVVRTEHPNSNAAIAATAGLVRAPAGWQPGQPPARTEFSSSTGGWTAGGAFPPVEDLGDANGPGNPHHTWAVEIAPAHIEAAYGRPPNSFLGARVLERNGLGDWGGRVRLVELSFTAGALVVTGDDFRIKTGIRSNWFTFSIDFWEPVGGVIVGAPAGVSWGPGRYDVFATGVDNQLWHRPWEQGFGWQGWIPLGGQLTSGPAASSWGPGRLDIVARGLDGAVWHQSYDGTRWVGWESLGGIAVGSPAGASWAPGRYDIFVTGIDNQLWHRYWAGAGWSGWEPLGGHLTSGPAVSSWGPGRLDIVARGLDGAVWHQSWHAGRWIGWESLGGVAVGSPTGTSWGPGRYDIFVTGVDNQLWHRYWAGAGWSAWEPFGGHLTSAPAASTWGPGRLDIVARGIDGTVWHRVHQQP
jgi:hypothetical protein